MVYLFSDGLPNGGPGLTPADQKRLAALESDPRQAKAAEQQRGELLGAYLRKEIREKWNPTVKVNGKDTCVRIESIGFFYENPDLGSFLWALSRENGGNFVGMSRPSPR